MNIKEIKKDEILYNKDNNHYNRDLLSRIHLEKRKDSEKTRKRLFGKMYLGQIVKEENPEFGSNNLILAPVGSGKSYLIEEMLIPKKFNNKIVYLTSNTALKDSLCPNDNELRKLLAESGQSVNFFTSENKTRYGDKSCGVHVMTYHEFGLRISAPYETFTKDVGLIFCDEIHSLPIFKGYGSSGELNIALRWLFTEHLGIDIYYFTATEHSILELEKKAPGHLTKVKQFNYLNHPKIRRYEAKSIYYVSHIEQIRVHLKARLISCNRNGYKGLSFTRMIREQKKIEEIALEEGFKPLVLWSTNNEEEMSGEQIQAREYILNTGHIPEPYNLLIINGSMQEGWNLYDEKVIFAILDTTDETEQIQALGRVRKDIDFVVYKTDDEDLIATKIVLKDEFLNKPLERIDKELLCEDINIIDNKGRITKWRGIKIILEKSGYILEDRTLVIDGQRKRTTTITKSQL